MRLNEIFGFLLVLLAIYLGVHASGRADADDGLFDGLDDDPAADVDVDVDEDADRDVDVDVDVDRDRRRRDRDEPRGVVARSDFCRNAIGDSRFDDLGERYDEAVRCMEAAGVVTGVSSNTYAPRDALTRAQAASTIAALITSGNRLERTGVNLRSLPEAPQARFVDVEAESPHADAIARLNEAGIIEGYVDARFEPQGRVSRAQMASIIDRTYKYMTGDALPSGSDQFSDDDESVHEDSINAVAAADIMGGTGGLQFDPNQSVRRGPMAAFMARTMIRLEQTDRIRPLE
jgi:S-layer homology domain